MRGMPRFLYAALAGLSLAGCGTSAPAPVATPQNRGPAIPVVRRVINGDLAPITASGSLVLPLTGSGAKDTVRYTYSIASPQTLRVQEPSGRTLLSLDNVQAVGAVEFASAQTPLLLVSSATNGQWGYPVTAYVWDRAKGRLTAVPFSESAGASATYAWNGRRFEPDAAAGSVTALLGFASMGRSGLTVQQSVPQVATPFPSNYTLDSHWVFAEPPATGWWILKDAAFGPNRAPRGQEYPASARLTAEEYLTALALGLPRLAAGLAAPAAQRDYGRLSALFSPPGIGTPLPSFDESAFNATAVRAGKPGTLTMYGWSGSGLGLRLSVFSAQVRLRRSQGQWQVTAVRLQGIAVNHPTPESIVPLLAGQSRVTAFVRRHPRADISIAVQSGSQFSAQLGYPGAPASFVPPTFTVDALTGAVVYAGY